MSKYNQIITLLDQMDADYEVSEHEDVVTSKQAEEVTGFPIEKAAKSIVFKIGGDFVLIVVRGSHQADFKKIRSHFGTRKARLATPDEVFAAMGVQIGACYPFGSVAGLPMIVDETLAENDLISFSPGAHDKHIRMPWIEYQRVVEPDLVDIYKI